MSDQSLCQSWITDVGKFNVWHTNSLGLVLRSPTSRILYPTLLGAMCICCKPTAAVSVTVHFGGNYVLVISVYNDSYAVSLCTYLERDSLAWGLLSCVAASAWWCHMRSCHSTPLHCTWILSKDPSEHLTPTAYPAIQLLLHPAVTYKQRVKSHACTDTMLLLEDEACKIHIY